MTQQAFNQFPIGQMATFSQQLRFVWKMTGSMNGGNPNNYTFTANLNTLSWTWTKISATQ
jgi:hypothetical protein